MLDNEEKNSFLSNKWSSQWLLYAIAKTGSAPMMGCSSWSSVSLQSIVCLCLMNYFEHLLFIANFVNSWEVDIISCLFSPYWPANVKYMKWEEQVVLCIQFKRANDSEYLVWQRRKNYRCMQWWATKSFAYCSQLQNKFTSCKWYVAGRLGSEVLEGITSYEIHGYYELRKPIYRTMRHIYVH